MRLGPSTRHIPKALVQVAGQPFLSHQLALLRDNGVRRVLLLVGHLGEQIQEAYGSGDRFGLSIDYSFDGPVLLGTAGAIRQAMSQLPERFFVLYGDSYLTCDFGAVAAAFRRSGQPALMTVFRNEGSFDRSNIEFDGSRIVRYDKRHQTPAMRHIDYGLCAFDRRVFAALPAGVNIDLVAVCQTLIAADQLAAFEVGERFYEIGSPEGLRDTETYLRAQATRRGHE
jgi:NDP-sugar pyrophosphorylase family protein